MAPLRINSRTNLRPNGQTGGKRRLAKQNKGLAHCEAGQIIGAILMRKILILTALGAALLVSACNTIAGAGKDVSATGHAVTNTADDAKH